MVWWSERQWWHCCLLQLNFIFLGEVLYTQVPWLYNFPIPSHLLTCNLSDPALYPSCLWALLIPAWCLLSTAQLWSQTPWKGREKSINQWHHVEPSPVLWHRGHVCCSHMFSHQRLAQCKCEIEEPQAQSQLWQSILWTNEQTGFYWVYWNTVTRSNKLVRGSTTALLLQVSLITT